MGPFTQSQRVKAMVSRSLEHFIETTVRTAQVLSRPSLGDEFGG